jgi:hypothetical protein
MLILISGLLAGWIAIKRERKQGHLTLEDIKVGDEKRKVSLIALAVLASTLVVQVGSSLADATSDGASRYYYGEVGMPKLLDELASRVPPGELVIAAKDIGLQVERPFVEDAAFFFTNLDTNKSILMEYCAQYLVTREKWDYSEPVYPRHFDEIRAHYSVSDGGVIGDFRIWEMKEEYFNECAMYAQRNYEYKEKGK